MGASSQVVRPPQRGIFPLDHLAECREAMVRYVDCLADNKDMHHKCRDFSKEYLKCRMDHQLMSEEPLEQLGYSDEHIVEGAKEYDYSKEKAGFIAGKHIAPKDSNKWWWQR
jgi:cytochrome c oxidase assembly protein subunit 19